MAGYKNSQLFVARSSQNIVLFFAGWMIESESERGEYLWVKTQESLECGRWASCGHILLGKGRWVVDGRNNNRAAVRMWIEKEIRPRSTKRW